MTGLFYQSLMYSMIILVNNFMLNLGNTQMTQIEFPNHTGTQDNLEGL
jgi:hypothetical protein